MRSDELRSVEDKHDVPAESTLGVAFILAPPLHSFIALDWDHRASQKTSLVDIDPFQRPDLIDDVMKSAGVMLPRAAVRRPTPIRTDYIDLLRQCRFVALQGRVDFTRGADLIMAQLET